MPRPDDDDERYIDAVDERGVLRDGKSIRVGLMMADAARRSHPFLHDGHGGPVGNRPGFIVSDASRAIRDEAYRQSVVELSNAWRHPNHNTTPSTEAAPMSATDAVRTDLSTLMARLSDARRSAYDAYVDELSNAWRRP